jgi:hypothetical protein
VLASDVLYEERNVLPCSKPSDALVGPAGEAWITDPRAPQTPAFLELAAETWRVGTLPSSKVEASTCTSSPAPGPAVVRAFGPRQ